MLNECETRYICFSFILFSTLTICNKRYTLDAMANMNEVYINVIFWRTTSHTLPKGPEDANVPHVFIPAYDTNGRIGHRRRADIAIDIGVRAS